MSPVEEVCKKYITFIDILSNGTEEDISSLNIQHDNVDMLNDQISKLDYGIAKLLYTFFIAENSDAWKTPYVNSYNNEKPLNQYFYRIQKANNGACDASNAAHTTIIC